MESSKMKNGQEDEDMFSKKTVSILAAVLIVGALGVAGVVMAAPAANGMPCADPTVRQQMMDSHVKSGFMTQEQADQMNRSMNQRMNGGMMNPANPAGPQGNTTTPGK